MSITIKEIKFVMLKHLMWKYPGPGGTIREFYQTVRKECFKTCINTDSTYFVETKEDETL